MARDENGDGMMKAIRVHGPGDLRIDDIARVEPGDRDVVVSVKVCGICGSDAAYVAMGGVAAPAAEPFGIGHELAGVVEAVGAEVTGISPGMRVVVNPMGDGNAIGNGMPEGAFAPSLLVRGATLGGSILPIADDLPFDRAALAEPLSVALHAVRRAAPQPGSKVAVFGAGPIGLGIIFFLRRAGVEDVVAIDLSEERLKRAAALGARATINPAREDVRERLGALHGTGELFGWPVIGTDLFFEVSGAPGIIPLAIELAPFQARLVVVAVHKDPVPVNFQQALGKEMTILTAMAYPDEFPEVLDILHGDADLSPLVSHRFDFADFMEAFETARAADRSAKVLVTFGER